MSPSGTTSGRDEGERGRSGDRVEEHEDHESEEERDECTEAPCDDAELTEEDRWPCF